MSHPRSTAGRSRVPALLRVVALGGVAVTLAGCYTREARAPYPIDYRQRHPITLANGNHTVEVFLGQNRGGLSPAQRADVLAFAQAWQREATSGILVEVPKGGRTDRAAHDSLREIHSILAASAVPGNGVRVSSYRAPRDSLAAIRLNYSRLTAKAGPCGRWPDDLGPSDTPERIQNYPYWNLGCASQRNLAAMVDNPADLVQPRGETPAMASRRAIMMDKYRKGEAFSATYPNDAGSGYGNGKLSDLGK